MIVTFSTVLCGCTCTTGWRTTSRSVTVWEHAATIAVAAPTETSFHAVFIGPPCGARTRAWRIRTPRAFRFFMLRQRRAALCRTVPTIGDGGCLANARNAENSHAISALTTPRTGYLARRCRAPPRGAPTGFGADRCERAPSGLRPCGL